MNYIIDIALVAVLVFTVIFAAKKGFFLTLAELISYVASFVIAKIASTALTNPIYEQFIQPGLSEKVKQSLGEAANTDYTAKISNALDEIPHQLDGVLQLIGIDREAIVNSVNSTEFSGKTGLEVVMDKIINPVSTAVIQTLLFIIISIVAAIILRVVVKACNKIIKKLPAIKQVNSSLGGVLGIIKGILVVVIIALALGALSGVFGSEKFVELVNNSFVVKLSHNLIDSVTGYAA